MTDRGIVGTRRLLLTLAKDLQKGTEPPHSSKPRAFRVRSVAVEASRSIDPVELFRRGQPESVEAQSLGGAY